MVNIQPIPPLLCSTPPPIDFGEDDEDMDVLSPPDGEENEFGDFLTEDETKTNEPLPSPRPPSICDYPPITIYDSSITPDEEDLTNHKEVAYLTSTDDKLSKTFKNNTKSINLTEAFNFNVKNTTSDDTTNVESETTQCTHKTEEEKNSYKPSDIVERESNNSTPNKETIFFKCKNPKDLTIASLNVETEYNSKQMNRICLQDMVSIEDIVDDLSDDELYSPKTPKNFIETDNPNDYFKIEEIKMPNTTENEVKLDSTTVEFLDNNESASLENKNDNEFESFSSNSFMQDRFDLPPSPPDDAISIVEDDEFGDFADFQEAHFQNNTVPVNDKQHYNLELTDFSDFNKLTNATDTNITNANESTNEATTLNRLKDSTSLDEEFNNISSNNSIDSSESDIKQKEMSQQESLNSEKISQETAHDKRNVSTINNEEYKNFSETNKSDHSLEELRLEKNSFDDLNATTEINVDCKFEKFAEFSQPSSELESYTNGKISETSKEVINDDDDFDDFADFESHQQATIPVDNNLTYCEVKNNIDSEDDDFGDFNTAEPITSTGSSITLNTTSQNTSTVGNSSSPPKNLNERISKILQLMFTPGLNQANENFSEPKTDKIKDIPFTSIDTAKALEYQWLISDTRHSFIKSLGIDSRNILYGDNWNPSLPRFAANLSFNPLKPMKPVQAPINTSDTTSMLEPAPINRSETPQTLGMPYSKKMDTLNLNWKAPNAAERTHESGFVASTDNNINPPVISTTPCIPNEPPTVTANHTVSSLTILESSLDNEDNLSKTPPISEMESVTAFSSPLPTVITDIEPSTTPIATNVNNYDLKELENNLQNTLNINEVVATSTFTGSFKETHIFTPTKANDFEVKQHATTVAVTPMSTSPTKASPIDFDYEKAAMGVIIDETVVKKEYRDVEYKPPFSMEALGKSLTIKADMFESNNYNSTTANMLNSTDIKMSVTYGGDIDGQDDQESSDDFSEFQSVSSEVAVPAAPAPMPKTLNHLDVPKVAAVSHGGMILSPAILIPQAISMENQKPKIEWGESTTNINPEELARIEELFPEPKSIKSSNSSQKSTPTHQISATPSISAAVANKELEGNINNINDDDDDWSDFVSVTVTNNSSINRTSSNNNILSKSPVGSPFNHRSPVVSHRMPPTTHNSNCDDEWSEFVSSAPPSQQSNVYRVPQFNSGAWQNANFYNNPLSMYHKGPINLHTSAVSMHGAQKPLYNNNNNNNYNVSQQPYQIANNLPAVMMDPNQPKPNNAYQQQVHIMQNFSTAPVPIPERLSAAANTAAVPKTNQFQSIGSAKVAPSIALIPDLGFVAPAIPTHTSFINSLPKPSISMKK